MYGGYAIASKNSAEHGTRERSGWVPVLVGRGLIVTGLICHAIPAQSCAGDV